MNSNTPFRPAERIAGLGVSEILRISARAAAMKRAGGDVIILGAGEPDFDTPDHIKEAAARAMRDGATKYTALDGTAELKQAIADKFRADNGLGFELAQITVGAGAKQILFNAMMATLDPGDEVIIPTPFWTSYADIVRIAGGQPVLIPCADTAGFRLTAEQLERAITPRTRWLMLNSPSNPTGAGYSALDYAPLLEVLARHRHVWLMVDDIYEKIVYDGFTFSTPAQIAPELRDRILTINGVSKAYAMTGWRVGYAAGPKRLVAALNKMQSQSVTSVSPVAQAAALAALSGEQAFVTEAAGVFAGRARIIADRLARIPELDFTPPDGAFYAFIGVKRLLGSKTAAGEVIADDTAFAAHLLQQFGLSSVPGAAFGAPGFIRLSIAASDRELELATERLAAMVHSLTR